MKSYLARSLIVILALSLSSCVETTQDYFITKKGKGKVEIEATMASGGQLRMKRGRGDLNQENSYDDKVKMVEKVRKIINESEGVEAWKNLDYHLDEEGRIVFNATAYFNDIEKFNLTEIPSLKVKKFNEDGAAWAFEMDKDKEQKGSNPFQQKSKKEQKEELSEKEVDEKVEQLKNQYKRRSKLVKMALNMFEYEATYHFPYKIKSVKDMKEVGNRQVKGTLEGDQIINTYDDLMENDEQLRKLVKEKGVRSFDFDNEAFVKAVKPEKNLMSVTFKTGLFSGSPKNPFNYEEEVKQIDNKIPSIPKPKRPAPETKTTVPDQMEYQREFEGSKYAMAKDQGVFIYFHDDFGDKKIKFKHLPSLKNTRAINIPDSIKTKNPGLALSPNKKRILFFTQGNDRFFGKVMIYHTLTEELIASKVIDKKVSEAVWMDNQNFALGYKNGAVQMAHVSGQIELKNSISIASKPEGWKSVNLEIDFRAMNNGHQLITFENQNQRLRYYNVGDDHALNLKQQVKLKDVDYGAQLSVGPNQEHVALLAGDKIQVFKGTKKLRTIDQKSRQLSRISWSPDGTYMTYINNKNMLIYHEVSTGQEHPVKTKKKLEKLAFLDLSGQYLVTSTKGGFDEFQVFQIKGNP